ncbi:hypothetical protein [Pyxidicoccus xibeiensis]|uniref:hypothetical protein n=1 Tax=Pyxidicoccus xibeiensis TaxID=2906759 RepID=UPI0020A6EC40|nr:hypothetical protein [Pyxidicoccus xibeiensis]MCP3139646.1 hypothetical protein [Pyxidicoccus xibeiensis]
MSTPTTPQPSRGGSRKVLPLLLAGLVLLGLAAGAVFFFRSRSAAPGGGLFQAEQPTDTEARVNVLALCDAVQGYRDEHGAYLALAPEPKEVPRGGVPVPFPVEGPFHAIGFEPGEKVRFQYEVVVQESPVGEPEVSCLARGDFDGDGQNSVYRVRLDANGMTSPVEVEREGE